MQDHHFGSVCVWLCVTPFNRPKMISTFGAPGLTRSDLTLLEYIISIFSRLPPRAWWSARNGFFGIAPYSTRPLPCFWLLAALPSASSQRERIPGRSSHVVASHGRRLSGTSYRSVRARVSFSRVEGVYPSLQRYRVVRC